MKLDYEQMRKRLMVHDLNGVVYGVQNLRTCIVGDEGTGKSTILGVLRRGALLTDLPKVMEKFWVDIPTQKPGKIDCHMLVCDTDGKRLQTNE